MFNQVTLSGNLTKSIKHVVTQNSELASTSIAVNEKHGQNTETLFIEILFLGKLANIAKTYLKVGSKVLISGKLKLKNYTNPQGVKIPTHYILVDTLEMLSSNKDKENVQEDIKQEHIQNQTNSSSSTKNNNDDEIPF